MSSGDVTMLRRSCSWRSSRAMDESGVWLMVSASRQLSSDLISEYRFIAVMPRLAFARL